MRNTDDEPRSAGNMLELAQFVDLGLVLCRLGTTPNDCAKSAQ
jgi:hypothetical protein